MVVSSSFCAKPSTRDKHRSVRRFQLGSHLVEAGRSSPSAVEKRTSKQELRMLSGILGVVQGFQTSVHQITQLRADVLLPNKQQNQHREPHTTANGKCYSSGGNIQATTRQRHKLASRIAIRNWHMLASPGCLQLAQAAATTPFPRRSSQESDREDSQHLGREISNLHGQGIPTSMAMQSGVPEDCCCFLNCNAAKAGIESTTLDLPC